MSSVDERLRGLYLRLDMERRKVRDIAAGPARGYWKGREVSLDLVLAELETVFPELTQEDRPERRGEERRKGPINRRFAGRFTEQIGRLDLNRRDPFLHGDRRTYRDRRSPAKGG